MKQAREEPKRFVLLFEDETTLCRQPAQAWLRAHLGRRQPRMRYSHRSNTRMRVIGCLNARTGAVHSQDMGRVTVQRLARSVSKLSTTYPHAEMIFMAWDNWPNHTHGKVLEALEKQPRVKLLWLPTYAPWLKPAEKLWRWTRQRVPHAHPWCHDFRQFRQQMNAELASLSEGSEELLRYVGFST